MRTGQGEVSKFPSALRADLLPKGSGFYYPLSHFGPGVAPPFLPSGVTAEFEA